jgi:hypothetical protein
MAYNKGWRIGGMLAAGLFCAAAAFGKEATGPNGTYECWDRCTEMVGCNTTCYDSYDRSNSGPQITCGDFGSCDNPPPPTCKADPCTNCYRPAVGVDADGDGVPDALEYDLAYRFFPDVRLQWITSDLNQAYPYQGKSIPFTVHAGPASGICAFDGGPNHCLEIRYGLAYRNDCGDNFNGMESNGDCDPYGGLLGINGGHRGDSEFYAALVRRTGTWTAAQYDASQWVMIRDFTAAHWRSGADSSMMASYSYCPPNCSAWNNNETACRAASGVCSWFGGMCTGIDAQHLPCNGWGAESCVSGGGSCFWIPTACIPTTTCYSSTANAGWRTLYASEGKHALYHSDRECDDGGFALPFLNGADECPTNRWSLRDYVQGKLQNVGELGSHAAFDTYIQHPDFCHSYDVWSGAGFADSTDYKSHFTYPFYWGVP